MKYLNTLLIPTLIFFAMFADSQQSAQSPSLHQTIAIKRTKDMEITVLKRDGGFTGGENTFCVLFGDRATGKPVSVSNFSADFRQLVGRIVEQPLMAVTSEIQEGEYCGHADLGRLYYDPSNYHLFIHYRYRGKKQQQYIFVSATSRNQK